MLSFQTLPGFPQPYGVSMQSEGINFALFSSSATSVTLCLYARENRALLAKIALHPKLNRTGNVWHILVKTAPSAELCYAYAIDQFPGLLLDPYAKELVSSIR